MTSEELKNKIVDILNERKVDDMVVLNVSKQTEIADYMVILTGKTNTNVKSLAELVDVKLKQEGIMTLRKDGETEGRWIVLDYGDVLVHIFNKETRGYYQLEKLWSKEDNSTIIDK